MTWAVLQFLGKNSPHRYVCIHPDVIQLAGTVPLQDRNLERQTDDISFSVSKERQTITREIKQVREAETDDIDSTGFSALPTYR